jgi:hypothetical protein
MEKMMDHLLSHWPDRAILPLFVNRFAKVHSPVSAISLVDNTGGRYGRITDLSHFFSECLSISDWGEGGSFPPPGFIDPAFNSSGITKYVVQSWYPILYEWIFALDTQTIVWRQHVVVGSSGIGKSSFGLYFIARLISSQKPTFCRHEYFAFAWRQSRTARIHTFRVSLISGSVVRIPFGESERAQGALVFHLLDGHSLHENDPGPPCLSIISPSQMVHWKIKPDISFAPSLDVYDLPRLSGISTLYGFEPGDPEVAGFPADVYGTIETRMTVTFLGGASP